MSRQQLEYQKKAMQEKDFEKVVIDLGCIHTSSVALNSGLLAQKVWFHPGRCECKFTLLQFKGGRCV